MNTIKTIRDKLGVTQAQLAVALERSQGNVAFYERGQMMPPDVAKRLIAFARGRGVVVSFEDIYGAVPPEPELASLPDTTLTEQQGVA